VNADAPSSSSPRLRHGVLTLSGYGLRLVVERGHLVVEDGVGTDRRTGRFSRIDRDLTRVVIIGHSGSFSLDAVAWLHDLGVPLIHLSHDGRVYFVSTPAGTTIAPLRRAQGLAQQTPGSGSSSAVRS
jgi:CRISPR/Cas system-associated endonuclease Cas1